MIGYRKFLQEAHRQLCPELYLEIGVRSGHSLALSRCRSYGIDPEFGITEQIDVDVRLFRQTSDDFFARGDLQTLFARRIDLAFIDGMHHFECAYRDFMNVERYSSPGGVVIFDDVLPRSPAEATRERATTAWTGDVWKILYILIDLRPDLILIPLNTDPTGLLMVCNLDPANTTLARDYERAVAMFNSEEYARPGPDVLCRTMALSPEKLLQSGLLSRLASAHEGMSIAQQVRNCLPGVLLPGAYPVEAL